MIIKERSLKEELSENLAKGSDRTWAIVYMIIGIVTSVISLLVWHLGGTTLWRLFVSWMGL